MSDLGEAKGRITVDTTQPEQAAARMQQVGKKVTAELGQVDAAAKKTSVSLGSLGKILGAAGGLFGLQIGVGGIAQVAKFINANAQMAVQYKRQEVAARSLAGSQQKLNDLMAAYQRVTKGTVDDATALGDVTRLQAMGFADTTKELERFLGAARGISIAMGKDQDYVISQMQLAIANQSVMRLDQIGMGVAEVKDRIAELKRENKGMTDELAYQNAILGLAEEKYGALNNAVEAQATGAERATKAFKDLRLAWGMLSDVQLGEAWGDLADILNIMTEFAESDVLKQIKERAG